MLKELIRWIISRTTMENRGILFTDVVVNKPVYLYMDCYGTEWMSFSFFGHRVNRHDQNIHRSEVRRPADGDFYIENGLTVFTEEYHIKRGYCCGSGCRHCPYTPKHQKGNKQIV